MRVRRRHPAPGKLAPCPPTRPRPRASRPTARCGASSRRRSCRWRRRSTAARSRSRRRCTGSTWRPAATSCSRPRTGRGSARSTRWRWPSPRARSSISAPTRRGGGVRAQVRDPPRARRGRRARGGTARRSTTRRCGARSRARWARGSSAPPRRARGCRSASYALAAGVTLALDAGGFGRHTFLCGQSGSGKTYSLGVILEQLLLETGAADRRARPELGLRPHRRGARRRRARARASAIAPPPRASPSTAPGRPAATGCGSGSPSSTAPRRPRCCGWTRSQDREEHARAGRAARRRGRAAAWRRSWSRRGRRRSGCSLRARNLGVDGSGCGRAASPARCSRRSATAAGALRGRRPRLAADARGAGARRRGGARRAVGAARAARAGPDRHRRGAQRLPRRAGRPR